MFAGTICLAALAAAPAAEPVPVDPKVKAAELVRKLGDPAFRIREGAAKALLELGMAARDALEKGRSDPDAEISDRCRKLLPQILERDLADRVQAFLKAKDDKLPDDLPGVRRWAKIVGTDAAAKEAYSEVVKGNAKLLHDVEFARTRLPPRSGTSARACKNASTPAANWSAAKSSRSSSSPRTRPAASRTTPLRSPIRTA